MLSRCKILYFRYRMIVNYLIFGVATTLVNWVVYSLMVGGLEASMNIGNIVAWLASVVFAFFTNKIWVFESRKWDPLIMIKEGASFIGSRLISGVFEIGTLPLLVNVGLNQPLFGIDGFVAKILVSVVVVVLNYVFSKLFVFKEKRATSNTSVKD